MMARNPTFVFVHGAWHLPNYFDGVRGQLKALGLESEAVRLPSVGVPETHGAKTQPGLDADAAAVRHVLHRLLADGKQVVLCVHSYGGLVGAQALGASPDANGAGVLPAEKLGFKHRAAAGLPGGVIMLAYVTAFVAPAGQCVWSLLQEAWPSYFEVGVGSSLPPHRSTALTRGCFDPSLIKTVMHQDDVITVNEAVHYLYHDLPPAVAEEAVQQLQTQSKKVTYDKITYEPWNDGVECAYFFCDQDRCLAPEAQEISAGLMPADILTYRSNSAHTPFLACPEKVTEFLIKAAKVGQEKCKGL